jgi:hypothetical protein
LAQQHLKLGADKRAIRVFDHDAFAVKGLDLRLELAAFLAGPIGGPRLSGKVAHVKTGRPVRRHADNKRPICSSARGLFRRPQLG